MREAYMNVLTAAWIGAGSPTSCREASVGCGSCAKCGAPGGLVPTRSVVSKTFTGFDHWADPSGAGLCAVCRWGYSLPALRAVPHLISREPTVLRRLSRFEVGAVLRCGALGADQAVVVPLRPGRKHVFPSAVWGRVNVDDARLSWGVCEAGLLQLVVDLRQVGFGTRMLAEPAPPFAVMKRLEPGRWSWVLQAWDQLTPWRVPDNPWLQLALAVTTPALEAR